MTLPADGRVSFIACYSIYAILPKVTSIMISTIQLIASDYIPDGFCCVLSVKLFTTNCVVMIVIPLSAGDFISYTYYVFVI